MKRFLNSLLANFRSSTPRRERRATLRVEGLEERLALSTVAPVSPSPTSVGAVRGVIIAGGRTTERGIIAITTTGLESPLAARGFNPQPEPPADLVLRR